jgi:hypothetical protein
MGEWKCCVPALAVLSVFSVPRFRLITKVSIFQFINSYIALFYVAFLKGNVRIFGEIQQCDQLDCLRELCVWICVRV